MSGGVDSSVAAAVLTQQGHEVIGVTMKNFCYSELPEGSAAASCCSIDAIEDARRVAHRFGFPHYVLDFEDAFGRAVVDDFVDEYAAGRTPNPCVRCNRLVRFPHLHARVRAFGAEALATGHYARTRLGADARPRLLRGADRAKDQSYYLWGLTGKLLERTLFPVGHLRKPQVRKLAAELGIEVAEKPESMEVCFIPDGDLRGFLRREVARRPLPEAARERFTPGPVVSTTGRPLGVHPGSAFLTIGQRRGVGLAAGEPRYVVGFAGNAVVVGTREDLLATGCVIGEVSWIAGAAPDTEFDAEVQVRHRQPPVPCRVALEDGGRVHIDFAEPIPAVTPGQSAALYRGEEVLGGGIIR